MKEILSNDKYLNIWKAFIAAIVFFAAYDMHDLLRLAGLRQFLAAPEFSIIVNILQVILCISGIVFVYRAGFKAALSELEEINSGESEGEIIKFPIGERPAFFCVTTPIVFLAVSLLGTLSCQGQKVALGKDDSIARIEKAAVDGIKKHNFPSIAIGIVRDGNVVYAKGHGLADRDTKRTATADTVYQMGSVTKTFTGNVLSQLLVEKKISLDDRVSTFFPKTLKFPTHKNSKTVTVRDIATHSAEFPRYPANLERTDGEPILGFSKQQLYHGIELVKIENVAGGRYSYSNFGYGVLGTALENLTGKTLDALLDERIFHPLKMKNSSLVLKERIKTRLAIPYRDDDPNQKTEPWNMGALSGAGNIFSSVNDMNLFMIEMLKDSDVNRTQQTVYLKINETWNYGLGCFVINSATKKTRLIHHGGDIDGYASYLILYPEYKGGLVILTNSGMGQQFGEIAEAINEIVFNEEFKNAGGAREN